ncbi:hypothetical protein PGTUg99_020294 [Puccinia graminis f. sp. tritici]|uniref:Uncharacterized protein n=1 Tax=Puccinia graminis f. sp. tritici TaxID=56615 RepID=A0A5B0RLA9_PUCGR|nr:hypothetical protein PGTUg99_020294 [Puccinia graminis f. sp. tritici]
MSLANLAKSPSLRRITQHELNKASPKEARSVSEGEAYLKCRTVGNTTDARLFFGELHILAKSQTFHIILAFGYPINGF